MLERFYQQYSRVIAVLICLTLPLLTAIAMQLDPGNDLETWMPESDPSRVAYEEFKRTFGGEEFILIAFNRQAPHAPDAQLIESLCVRLERLPEIRHCWSADRMLAIMDRLGVPRDVGEQRLRGLLTSDNGELTSLVAMLSSAGHGHRTATVKSIREELRYCQLEGAKAMLAGSPLFIAELDRLGSKQANTGYFFVTLGICWGILYYLIREWKLTGLVFTLTVWTIGLTIVLLHFADVEINLLLSSIPVLVMVLTMSISVHYLYYYREALDHREERPVMAGLRAAWWPTLIATFTTCLGELALSVSDIAPIRHFAYAASMGSVLSMITGLGLTPVCVILCPTLPRRTPTDNSRFHGLADWIVSHSRSIAAATILLTVAACWGLPRLKSDMNVADFLPQNSKVRQDFLRVENELAPVNSIEVVVSFDDDREAFVERLTRVREIEKAIHQHPAVVQTLSLADFFPDPLPPEPLTLLRCLKSALEYREDNEFVAEGESLWRISARLRLSKEFPWQQVARELEQSLADDRVKFTGLSVLVEGAQQEIFSSFWQSIVMALVLITVAIMVFLRSIRAGLTAMIPNLAPLCWVYGLLGWLGWPIDIAMMLSGSIALGLSVDGTFHFMSHFQQHRKQTGSTTLATRSALLESSIPFSQATLTAMAGMVGLTLSSFLPTVRFGWLMIALMIAALIGDVIMLPALVRLLCDGSQHCRSRPEPHTTTAGEPAAAAVPAPHFPEVPAHEPSRDVA